MELMTAEELAQAAANRERVARHDCESFYLNQERMMAAWAGAGYPQPKPAGIVLGNLKTIRTPAKLHWPKPQGFYEAIVVYPSWHYTKE